LFDDTGFDRNQSNDQKQHRKPFYHENINYIQRVKVGMIQYIGFHICLGMGMGMGLGWYDTD
jgi:hypothetical protein